MEIGEKLLLARQEAGLSQRQLCEGIVTRNMLSQIEHGSARPSMETLRALAARLQKPLSWFLEEDALTSPNQAVMAQLRLAWQAGDFPGMQAALEAYRSPDPVFDQEKRLLALHALLGMAQRAIAGGMAPYARELLDQAQAEEAECIYATAELRRRRLLLQAQADPRQGPAVCAALPSLDEELRLRAQAALEQKDFSRCAALLDAMEAQAAPGWHLLRGQAAMGLGAFQEAARYLHRAEDALPRESARLLETCYRELEDYKQAYFYACKQK